MKKVLGATIVAGLFVLAVPLASAQTNGLETRVSSTTASAMSAANVAAKIACVGAAVAAREASIDAAIATHQGAVTTAYSARATALGAAYSQTTLKAVQAGVKTAWSTFNTSTRNAQKAWMAARNTAWSAFRTAALACKAPSGTSDSANSSSEASGN